MNPRAFQVVEGPVAWLRAANIDTDQIIPARFLKQPRESGYGQYLFHDWRARGDAGPAGNVLGGAAVLAAGPNFGCGSSREAAVYALVDAGVRCVVAPAFGEIFRMNCMKNGVLPVTLAAEAIERLLVHYSRPGSVSARVDLQAQAIRCDGVAEAFCVEPFWKEALLAGLDEIELTLRRQVAIDRYVERRLAGEPWLVPAPRQVP